MEIKEAQRLRDLEKENGELKKLLADQMLKAKEHPTLGYKKVTALLRSLGYAKTKSRGGAQKATG